MRFFNVLFFLFVVVGHGYAQTLFEDSLKNASNATVNLKANAVKKVIKKKGAIERLISTNLESVIARGDIHLLYEAPQANGWSTMVFLHANPQPEFNGHTGNMGALGGGRLYLDNGGQTSSVFLQGLAGFNHYNNWDLMISVEIGQRLYWKKNIFLDVSLAVNRSYAERLKDPMAYLKANLTFGLDDRLIPFL